MKVCDPPIGAFAFLCLLSLAHSAPGAAQSLSSQTAMHAQVVTIYSFSPSTVTNEVRASKSKQMDAFWDEVKQNKDVELPLLRGELQNPTDPPFFLFDGSELLLALSQAPEDEQVAATAISKTDLKDVQHRQFLYTVHGLAVNGVDITPAALHMLDDPKFEVYLPEHGAYKLDHAACLLVAFLPLKTDIWLPSVIERIQAKPDITAMKPLLLLLFYAQTDQADQVLRSAASDDKSSQEVQELAKSVLKHERELGVGKKPSPAAEAKLREERRARMFSVSDEAMDDLEELTAKIAQARTPAKRVP